MNKWIIATVLVLALVIVTGCKQGATGNDVTGNAISSAQGNEGAQIVSFGMDGDGYLPREITVEAGKPVTLRNDGSLQGCATHVVQPELGINANFAQSNEYTFTPTKKGKFTIACSMGMWTGVMNVI
ncbi:cupredoxin domain-containing protein [Nanoarchaeota archaeon]